MPSSPSGATGRRRRRTSRERIATQLARTAQTGIALLPVCRRVAATRPRRPAVLGAAVATRRTRLWATVRTWNVPSFRVLDKLGFERDHLTADDRGELVWLTRALP